VSPKGSNPRDKRTAYWCDKESARRPSGLPPSSWQDRHALRSARQWEPELRTTSFVVVYQPRRRPFGLNSVEDFYRELLVPSFDEFRRDPLSVRRAISCAVFTRHLCDWVVEQHQSQFKDLGITHEKGPLPAPRAYLYKQYDGFKIVNAIANRSKRHTLTDPSAPAVESRVSQGFLRAPLLAFGTVSYLTVRYNGKSRIFRSC
jgi:hypothetical protein